MFRAVNENPNPFIYLNNVGRDMTTVAPAHGKRPARRAAIAPASAAVAAALAALVLTASPVHAEASKWSGNERGAVRLVSAAKAVGQSRTVALGLEFRLKPGWKTYWRIPGESGMPPRFDWAGSENLSGTTVIWPGPKRFAIAGMQSYGYAERVVLPVHADLAQPGKPTVLRLHLRYAICREVCVPEEARLTLALGPGAPAATAHARAIADFAARAPQPGATLGWKVESAGIVTTGQAESRRTKLVVDVASAGVPFKAPELVAEGGEKLHFGLSSAKLADQNRRVRLYVPLRRSAEKADETVEIGLTLLDGPRRGTFTIRVGASH